MVKIHHVKQGFALTRATYGRPDLYIDDSIFDIREENLLPCERRGANLDVSNKFSGDFSTIKDVHFLKGTYFDRDYFRRLYPNINVRIKPELSDVIIYDDKAIFENDIVPKYFASLTLKDPERVLYFNSDMVLNNIYEAVTNAHSYAYRMYGPIKLAAGSIIKTYIDNKANIVGTYLGNNNNYYEILNNLKKPYLSTTDALNKIPSSLKQNSLPIEECITYFNQIKCGDLQAMKTAMESFIMYNSDKYLPLQILFYSYYLYIQNNTKGISGLKQSNKLNLFYDANKNYILSSSTTMSNIFETLSAFSKLCSNIFIKTCPKTDWDLIRKFLLSKEFYDGANNHSYANLKIHSTWFDFITPPLAAPIVEISDGKAKDNNISEFVL